MKNILIIHETLSPNNGKGGVETVLLSYLDIFSRLVSEKKCNVDLLLTKEPLQEDLDLIPKNIRSQFNPRGLTVPEFEFKITCEVLPPGVHNPTKSDLDYYNSWKGYFGNLNRQRMLKTINDNDYHIIINFDGVLDDFINHYDISDRIEVWRWAHNNDDFINWEKDSHYCGHIMGKHTGFVFICDEMKQAGINCLENIGIKLKDKKVLTLYNPVNNKLIQDKISLSQNDIINSSLSDEDKNLLQQDYIVQVARLFDYKQHFVMLDIFHKLKQQKGIKEKLYILGKGPNYQALSDYIVKLGLENDCFLLGYREPFLFMKYAKLFIHTSNAEGLPTVFIESMICGTPVVAFDCPTGPRDILKNGEYGALVPLDDQEQFVETVYRLLTDETQRQHYIQKLSEAVTPFEMETIKEQLCQLCGL